MIESKVYFFVGSILDKRPFVLPDLSQRDKSDHEVAQICYDNYRVADSEARAEVYLQALGYYRKILSRYNLNAQNPFFLPL